ncbi:MAG TPA: hypothetical protein V6D17_05240 [Candidatus Obscuribacterales bacterium]
MQKSKNKKMSQKDFQRIDMSELRRLCAQDKETEPVKTNMLALLKMNLRALAARTALVHG